MKIIDLLMVVLFPYRLLSYFWKTNPRNLNSCRCLLIIINNAQHLLSNFVSTTHLYCLLLYCTPDDLFNCL